MVFYKDEQRDQINYLEILLAFFGLEWFAGDSSNFDVLLRIDNTTTIDYMNKTSGIQYLKLSNSSEQIWEWCEQKEFWIFESYVGSNENVEPDLNLDDLNQKRSLLYILPSTLKNIMNKFGLPDIDLFATRPNAKCRYYVSWVKDPGLMMVYEYTLD